MSYDYDFSQEIQIWANRFGFYAVPKEYKKRLVPRILREGNVYEPRTLEFIRETVGDGDVIAGGGFIGDFFPAISRGLHKDALLHSFEPNPLSYQACQETIALNRLENVRVHPIAVGSEAGELPLRIHDFKKNEPAAAQSRIDVDGTPGEGYISVEIKRIDDIIPEDRHVSIIQLDVEGFEYEAVKGAVGVISRCWPTLILEGLKVKAHDINDLLMKNDTVEKTYVFAGRFEKNSLFVAR